MLIGSSNCSSGASSAMRFASAAPPRARMSAKRRQPGWLAVAEDDDRAQRRQPCRFKLARRRTGQFGRELAQHADIVRGLETLGQDQRLAADLVERVFKLGDAIGRIDVDQDEPGLGGGELGEHPFAVVRRPDADAVARLQPERQQPGGEPVDRLLQLAVAHAHVLVAHDQRRPVRPSGRTRHRRTARWFRRAAAFRSRRRRSSASAPSWPFPPIVSLALLTCEIGLRRGAIYTSVSNRRD